MNRKQKAIEEKFRKKTESYANKKQNEYHIWRIKKGREFFTLISEGRVELVESYWGGPAFKVIDVNQQNKTYTLKYFEKFYNELEYKLMKQEWDRFYTSPLMEALK